MTQCQDVEQAVPQRAQAGRLLGDSGWLPDDLDAMVKIKSGPFLRGDKKEQARIKQDYWIAKYPVTNAQYRRFIEAKGYESAGFWSKEGWAWREKAGILIPSYWGDRKFTNPLSPVVGVSFYEAEAYCRWFGEQVHANPQAYALSADEVAKLTCRLPSNDEWERAARGTDGREYPWGNKFSVTRANCSESLNSGDGEHQGTTAVVTFPKGQSPDELLDCAGNVWEWMSEKDKDGYLYIRGGAWNYFADLLRCVVRDWFHPDYRFIGLGFRLVLGE